MMTLAVANQKGGVGKTSTALGIVASACASGRRVLVVDLDPQANASSGLGVSEPEFDSGDVIHANQRNAASSAIVATSWAGVDVIPASLALAEREHDQALGIEYRLRKALEGVTGYDLVVIDCPPSLGRLVTNALVAATHVLIVTEPAAAALKGVQNLLETIAVIVEHYNPKLIVAGVVFNRVPARSREAELRIAELTDADLGVPVLAPSIPARAVIAEAYGASAPIHDYGAKAADATSAYDQLTEQLLAL
jgi:chromosome partitioning protein